MEILKYLFSVLYYNNLIILNVYGVYKDIDNYFYIRRCLDKVKKTEVWKNLKFRMDWIGRPYMVMNFQPEFFEQAEPAYQEYMIVAELSPMFKELGQYDLVDILSLKQKRIIDTDGTPTNGVLIYFKPVFYFTSFFNIITTLITAILISHFLI